MNVKRNFLIILILLSMNSIVFYDSAFSLSRAVAGEPSIFFPLSYDQAKADAIQKALRNEKYRFIDGLISYWEPRWSTTLSFGGDTRSLNELLQNLIHLKLVEIKVTFSKNLSQESGTGMSAGSWWVIYEHTHPNRLTIRINLASEDIDPAKLELLIPD